MIETGPIVLDDQGYYSKKFEGSGFLHKVVFFFSDTASSMTKASLFDDDGNNLVLEEGMQHTMTGIQGKTIIVLPLEENGQKKCFGPRIEVRVIGPANSYQLKNVKVYATSAEFIRWDAGNL